MQDILSQTIGGGFSPMLTVVSLVLSFFLSFIIASLYKMTHKGLSYSQSFTHTLIILSVAAAAAMMVIGSSLARAFGLAGALSIIRFRTVVKDTKDIAFVFWVLVVGMACGTQGHALAVFVTLIIGIIVFILYRIDFGSIRKHDYILRYHQNIDLISNDDIQNVLQTYLKSIILLTMNSHEEGKVFEFSYNIQLINETEQNNMLKALSSLKGVIHVYLLKATSDVNY